MKKIIALFASVVVFGSVFAQTPTATPVATATYVSSCQVKFPNGYTDTATCKGRIAVIDGNQKVQCAPKVNLIEKDGKVFFVKNRKAEPEPVTLCYNGASVKE